MQLGVELDVMILKFDYIMLPLHHCLIFLLSCIGFAGFDRTSWTYRRAGNTGFSRPEGSYRTSRPPCRLPTPTNSSPVTHPITQDTSLHTASWIHIHTSSRHMYCSNNIICFSWGNWMFVNTHTAIKTKEIFTWLKVVRFSKTFSKTWWKMFSSTYWCH